MSENEDEKAPGLEFDYRLGDDGMDTAVIIRDPNKMRKVVTLHCQWIPTVLGDGESPYPGMDALDAAADEDKVVHIPALIIGHMPVHIPPEKAVDDIQHNLYVLDQDSASNMIESGLAMFTNDKEQANTIMHMLFHMLGGEHDHEDGEDEAG